MTCMLCKEFKQNAEYVHRPCSKCGRPQPVCWLCGDGKPSGAVSFDHCCGQLELKG